MNTRTTPALCSATSTLSSRLALCFLEVAEDGSLPEWVELIPPGPEVNAADGRKFRSEDPSKVVDAFNRYGLDLPIDYEHATEVRAPLGEEAPAAGWIVEMQVRDGAVWGRVEWTPRGVSSLTAREYRYISPAFLHDKAGEIMELVSAGLTNKPALPQLAALANRAETSDPAEDTKPKGEETPSEERMNPEILKLLGLAETATEEEVVAAVRAAVSAGAKVEETETKLAEVESDLATARSEAADLSRFVPRADYDKAVARAQSAEGALASERKAKIEETINVEIDAALKAGKITPATVDYHKAACSLEGGLDRFRSFVESAPVVGADSDLETRSAPVATASVTESELAIARMCGISAEEFLAAKNSK